MRTAGNGGYNPTSTVQAGTPNGTLAGLVGDICFDTTGQAGYTCSVSGTSTTAVWVLDAASGSSFAWNNTTATTQAMAVQNGYISNNAALSTFTLPAAAAVGQRVSVQGSGAGGWLLAQNTGQTIHFGTSFTTGGTGGSLASTQQFDGVELICVTANTIWAVIRAQGNLTVV